MKEQNITSPVTISLSENAINQLKYIQGNEMNSILIENFIKINGFIVDQLSYNIENNKDYVDFLQSLNLMLKLIQSVKE